MSYSMKCRVRGGIGLALAVVAFVGLLSVVAPGVASAAEPWWHLSTGARPSLLHAPRDEVQEVQAGEDSHGSLVVKLQVKDTTVACLANSASVAACGEFGLPADRTRGQLQASLEGVYGAGNVQVSGGPAGSTPFLVTTPGREVPPLVAVAVDGSASVKQTAEGGSGKLVLLAFNLGDAPVDGSSAPVVLSDRLPAGLTATRIAGTSPDTGGFAEEAVDSQVKCSVPSVSCTFTGVLQTYFDLEAVVWVTRSETAASGEASLFSVSGGGAREASRSSVLSYGEGPVPFGVEAGSYELEPEEEGGVPDTQVGSHPYQLTTTLRMSETEGKPFQTAEPRNLEFYLPAGLVGDAQATPRCSYAGFLTITILFGPNKCAADTAIGVSIQQIIIGQPPHAATFSAPFPVFNLTPAKGEPARFGFEIAGVPVLLDTSVRTGGDYGVTVSVRNLSESAATAISSIVSIWGVPGDPRHDQARGWGCLDPNQGFEQPGCGPSLGSSLPLLSMPSACEPFQAPIQAQSWKPGAELLPKVNSAFEETLDGCGKLPFGALIEAAPDIQSASSPSGLTVHVRVPQEATLNSNGLTDADVRDTTVSLPAGMTLNPGGAAGLEACSETQIGFLGKEASDPALNLFTPILAEPFCPNGAKVGTVKITTPLLPNPIDGAVYIASPAPNGEPGMNPFDTLVAMYIVAEDSVSGTIVKLAGRVVPCEHAGETVAGVVCGAAGQLVSTFEDTPQVPFEDLELHFFGGANAPLATPALCGTYTTNATFTPWSGGAPVNSTSHFDITSGPNGTPCADPRPFVPEFVAESTNIQAGAFSELRTTMGHPDADQELGGLTVKMPPGLSGLLTGVRLCGEAEANAGTCGPESLIGHTVVTAGLGSSPVVVKHPGSVYITGPYKGAPFGLSIVNPAEAGPFNLGNVVVRAKIEVNPITAQLTVTSDPLPTILKGIPLDIQHVQVAIDRSGFTFNPTNCSPMKIEGSMSSDEGSSMPVAVPFQVTNCATLAFKPGFMVSTSGHTSRANGASLGVKLTYPAGSFGRDANIESVKVDLPKQLPSRLTTLQRACAAVIFQTNPAGCPVASIVGHAKAITPLIPVPLEGPAYFVSYGGEKFPELVIVLQGYGVTLDLHGETFINEKTGITSSTFKTVPDAPVGSFELTLPQGPYSALAANGDLCSATKTVTVKRKITIKSKGHNRTVTRRVKQTVAGSLVMPTLFIAQNGAAIKQNTPINVTGCSKKAKKARKASKHAKGGKKK